MSMQHRLQDLVVRTDPWTLFCAEYSQKMRVMTATPALEGKHAPTSASAVKAANAANGCAAELWEGTRLIVRFPSDEG